jgi:predicted hydrolase (HD superfamily)
MRVEEASMAITYEDALAKLHEWTDSLALRNHARGVEAAMRRAAYRYGAGAADEPQWAMAGLLHDADYDRWPEEHPRLIVAWLSEQGEPEIAQAVVAHFNPADVPELTPLDKALLACDELTGFVMACCLVRPDGIHSLSPSSVKKKLKDKSFAAKVKREDVYGGVERLGVGLDEHIQLVIDALTPHAEELGIGGSARPPGASP